MSWPNATRNCLVIIALTTLLASCHFSPTHDGVSDGPGKRIDASRIPDAVPKHEPIRKAGNKSPYTVFGKTYRVMPSAQGYRETGTASWYGSKFHGRNTSNGEVYNMYAMTAAHKTLPIPSYVKVTNLNNSQSVIVRVNDRGPFHGARIIDLSYAAALKLGYADNGTAKVRVEAINPADYQRNYVEAPRIDNRQTPSKGTYLQIGAFGDFKLADGLKQEISSLTAFPVEIQKVDRLFKVLVGPFDNQNALQSTKQTLKSVARLPAFVVRH